MSDIEMFTEVDPLSGARERVFIDSYGNEWREPLRPHPTPLPLDVRKYLAGPFFPDMSLAELRQALATETRPAWEAYFRELIRQKREEQGTNEDVT